MIEVNRQGEVWVFAEQEEGTLSEVPLELLGKARELADVLATFHGETNLLELSTDDPGELLPEELKKVRKLIEN